MPTISSLSSLSSLRFASARLFVSGEKIRRRERVLLTEEAGVKVVVSSKGRRVLKGKDKKGKKLSDIKVLEQLQARIKHIKRDISPLKSAHHDLLADIHESIGDSGLYGSGAKAFQKALKHRKKAYQIEIMPYKKALEKAKRKFAAAVTKLIQYAKKQSVPSSPAESAS